MEFVLDCSVACSFLLGDEADNYAEKVLNLLQKKKAIAPSIFLFEVANVFRTSINQKRCSKSQATSLLECLNALPITIYQYKTPRQMHGVLDAALDYNLSAYDASYLLLSKYYSIPLATLDGQLMKAAEKESLYLNF